MLATRNPTLDDAALMRRVASGDREAFAAIYDRHHASAYRLALRVTRRPAAAEEVVQDVFLKLWRTADRYDPDRGTLRTWLFAAIHNRGIDALRSGSRHDRNIPLECEGGVEPAAPELVDEQVVHLDEFRRARELVRALPVAQREAVELSYLGGLTQAQIAASVGIPLGTVKSRMRLALARLGEMACDSELVAT